MTTRAHPRQEAVDNPPPYSTASEAYGSLCLVGRAADEEGVQCSQGSAYTTKVYGTKGANAADSLPYSTLHWQQQRRPTSLRFLLLFLGLLAGIAYYRPWSAPAASLYGEEANFHSWSASLSWRNKGHHPHSPSWWSKGHHPHSPSWWSKGHHPHSPSWWKSLTGARPSLHHCVRTQKAVDGMLGGIHAAAAYAQTAEGHTDNQPANTTMTLPNVARYLEGQFLGVPDSVSAGTALKKYTSQLHVAGTKADYKSALQIQQEWAELLGAPKVDDPTTLLFDAGSPESIKYLTGDWAVNGNKPRVWTDTYYVWLNYPKNSSLSLADTDGKKTFTADLREDIVKEDPTSSQGNNPFHGYSKPGSVSGPIIYAGFCTIDDFAALKQKGVKVEGAITLCRYGGPFRGLKVRASADAGAVGTLIYSDPLEDGNVTEANGFKAYPHGPARQPSSVQRGSVQGLSFYPGDPGTPGEPSYKNASRLDPEVADSLPKIPSLPISFSNAKPLLEALVGHGINTAELENEEAHWVGKVPGVEEYWSGPSELIASMDNDMTHIKPRPIWNTYAFIPGLITDEVVITAVHRDAWTFGGADPSSGTAAMHEVVAGIGHLTKDLNWRPLRSILIASWDAEEYGLVGSTEFGEDYAQWLKKHAVAYFNTDVAAAGSALKVGASPSLAKLFREAGQLIEDPESREASKLNITTVTPLGSGSDYSVFLEHLGIPSSDIGYAYSAQNGDAVYHYHSNYDSFYFMEHFGDAGFNRISTIAKLLGLVTVRMSQSLFLQIDVGEYVDVIAQYIDEVQDTFEKAKRDGKLGKDRMTSNGKWQGCHHALFKGLRSSHAQLRFAAQELLGEKIRIEEHLRKLSGGEGEEQLDIGRLAALDGLPSSPLRGLLFRVAKINNSLRLFEQTFIAPQGLKDRPWYKSLLVGPGRWRGYGATALPGLTEAITLDGDWNEVVKEVKRLEHGMEKARKVLKRGISRGKGRDMRN